MISEAIIVAGGYGTRLQSAVPNLPKCLAPIAGKPFLDYVLAYLAEQNIRRFILALGYKAEMVQQHIQQYFSNWDISFSIEEEPLGTGGAIAKACEQIKSKYAIVANGDTLYKANIAEAHSLLNSYNPECLLFLKPMENIERYGVVDVNEKQQVISFQEKKFYPQGLINGGLYVLDVSAFLQRSFPKQFSFEKEYLEVQLHNGKIYGMRDDAYFIDIGIPEDFERANRELVDSHFKTF